MQIDYPIRQPLDAYLSVDVVNERNSDWSTRVTLVADANGEKTISLSQGNDGVTITSEQFARIAKVVRSGLGTIDAAEFFERG